MVRDRPPPTWKPDAKSLAIHAPFPSMLFPHNLWPTPSCILLCYALNPNQDNKRSLGSFNHPETMLFHPQVLTTLSLIQVLPFASSSTGKTYFYPLVIRRDICVNLGAQLTSRKYSSKPLYPSHSPRASSVSFPALPFVDRASWLLFIVSWLFLGPIVSLLPFRLE